MAKAFSPISVMIMFIVIILVAFVTNYLLVQQAAHLQADALKQAKDTAAGASTALITIKLYGDDGRDELLENFYQQLVLQPGSAYVDIKTLLLMVEEKNSTGELSPGTGPCVYDASHAPGGAVGFWTDQQTGKGFYAYHFVRNSTMHQPTLIQEGDIVELCYQLPQQVGKNDDLYIKTKSGTTVTLSEPVAIPFVLKQVVRLKN